MPLYEIKLERMGFNITLNSSPEIWMFLEFECKEHMNLYRINGTMKESDKVIFICPPK